VCIQGTRCTAQRVLRATTGFPAPATYAHPWGVGIRRRIPMPSDSLPRNVEAQRVCTLKNTRFGPSPSVAAYGFAWSRSMPKPTPRCLPIIAICTRRVSVSQACWNATPLSDDECLCNLKQLPSLDAAVGPVHQSPLAQLSKRRRRYSPRMKGDR
jgi:hypothetical protein